MQQSMRNGVLAAALLVGCAWGQSWSQVLASGPAVNGSEVAAAFHAQSNHTVMFVGGQPATWLYDGSTWRSVFTAATPPPRQYFAMVHDSVRGRIVLFGGRLHFGAEMVDTWEWDGSNWHQRTPATAPPARSHHSLAFDQWRGRTVLFGGHIRPNTRPTDTWEWDGNNWILAITPNAPDGSESGSMCYDVARRVCVLYGGRRTSGVPDGRTWEYDGFDWVDMTPAIGPGPQLNGLGLLGPGLVHDPVNRVSVLYGGMNDLNQTSGETWEHDGTRWRRVASGTPSPRRGFALAMDTERRVSVLYGGSTSSTGTWLRETWEYRSSPRIPGAYSVIAPGCPGSVGVPTNTVIAIPRLGETMWICLANLPPPQICSFLIGFSNTTSPLGTLPLSLAPVGAPGCFLRNSVETTVLVRGTNGFALFPVPVPGLTSMLGVAFFAQGLVLDPGVNPLGAVMSEAAAGVIGQ